MPSEWWTYGLADFLMFSPTTWWRLVARYHDALWPVQWAGLAMSVAGVSLAWRAGQPGATPRDARRVGVLLATAWCWVGLVFHAQWHATINLAGPWLAALFALQGLLHLLDALGPAPAARQRHRATQGLGWGLAAAGLLGPALLGALAGRSWGQIELFGAMPDPTALGGLGLWLAARSGRPWWLLPLPVLAIAYGLLLRWLLG